MANIPQGIQVTPPTSATIRFKDSPTKLSFSPSGVWGSANFQGQLVVNLFVDSREYPESINLKFNSSENTVSEKVNYSANDPVLVREVLATLVLTPQIAEVIGKWLITNAELLNNQLKAVQAHGPAKIVPTGA